VSELRPVAAVIPFRVPSGRRRLPSRRSCRRVQAGEWANRQPVACDAQRLSPVLLQFPTASKPGPAEAAPCSCRQPVSAPAAISQLCVRGARCMFLSRPCSEEHPFIASSRPSPGESCRISSSRITPTMRFVSGSSGGVVQHRAGRGRPGSSERRRN